MAIINAEYLIILYRLFVHGYQLCKNYSHRPTTIKESKAKITDETENNYNISTY